MTGEKFIDEVKLEKLEEASYHYQVWKKNPVTGKKLTIAQCEEPVMDNALEVVCEVRMIPGILKYAERRMVFKSQLWLNSLLGALLAVLIAMLYWQRGMRSYKGGALRRRNQKVGRGSEGGEHCEDRIRFPG